MSHHGFCLWLTGLPSAGKTTIAKALTPKLKARGWPVELLDGDEVRMGLSADLGFDRKSREVHASRVTFVAKLLARNGAIPIVALISPYASSRAKARSDIGAFVEVYVTTPLEVCEQRDVKGLYKKARAGVIHEMTGIDDPYEAPTNAEIVVDTVAGTPDESAEYILHELERLKWIAPAVESREPLVGGPAASARLAGNA
ncbi:MAG: adenylyl-sulfate kinase [Thermoplasmata archaeon]|nr:adenylyl-sulfate kinase [Thermoplasmata archaeon]